MAGTTTKSRRTTVRSQDLNDLIVNYNLLRAEVAEIRRATHYLMPGVVLTDPALKAGTSAATAWRNEAFTFTFRGKVTSAAAAETALTATTHDVAASKEAWYVLSVQTNGTSFTITKAADQTPGTVVLPTGPDNEIIVGYMQIVTGAGGIFDASTDALAVAGNITAISFVDAPAMSESVATAADIGDWEGTAITS